jgi:hypothetical protein
MYAHYSRLGAETGTEKTKNALIAIGIVSVGIATITTLILREALGSHR